MQSDIFRENAENCAVLAEAASNQPTFLRYKRMQAAWLALAHEQDWLDGRIGPVQVHALTQMASALGGVSKSIASGERK